MNSTLTLCGIVGRPVTQYINVINFKFSLTQQNLEKVKRYEYFLKALYIYYMTVASCLSLL